MPRKALLQGKRKMISINRVVIENFQSHENTELIFCDGLNVIVGPSDQGKSAILRAIKWVLYNEPKGNEFIRQGTNSARVTLELSSGYTITRERTPSKNRYVLKDSEGDSSVFEGFGSNIPYEIIKAHGIPKVIIDHDISSSLNIGEQLEGPFLISNTGSVRARVIGRLTGLHIIDKSIRGSATDLKNGNQTRGRISKELDDVNERLEEYKYLDLLEDRLEVSADHIKKIEECLERCSILLNIRASLIDIEQKYDETALELGRLKRLDECDILLKKVEVYYIKLKALDSLKNRYTGSILEIKGMENTLKETNNVSEGISMLRQIYETVQAYERLRKAHTALEHLERDYDKVIKVLDSTRDVEKIDGMITEIRGNITRLARLIMTEERLSANDKEISKVYKFLEQNVELGKSNTIIMSINQKSELLKKLQSLNDRYTLSLDNIKEGNNFLNNNKKDIENYLNTYISLLKEKGKCPLCDSDIGEDKLVNIIKHYEEVH